ncbi:MULTISPECIES: hypothetical protein [Olivibacter]|uniref:Phage portal protein n=1 Tax=Olivibacter jilunii TaxID=985016 RepID=A0ABW6AZG9_9SPHI
MSVSHIEYTKSGIPSVGFMEGGAVVFTSKQPKQQIKSLPPDKNEEGSPQKWVPWGVSDDFPKEVWKEVRKSGVARSALQLLTAKLYGQSCIPVLETGFDPKTKEATYETVDQDHKVWEFLDRSNFDIWRLCVIQDYVSMYNSFPMLMMNADRSEIVRLAHDKVFKFRYAPYNRKTRRIETCFRSANFPSPAEDELDELPVIDPKDWYQEVDRIKHTDSRFNYVFPTYYPDLLNDYYSLVYWDGVRSNGWLEISNSIPAYKRAIFKNQTTIKYHVKIPYSYWTTVYPNWHNMDEKVRSKIVNDKLEEMDKYLTGSENAMKTFISHFGGGARNELKKEDTAWEIQALDDKVKGDAYLPDSAAANAEILFSMLVNPALFGVGMPGGSYTGGANNGGSNIRESWLVMNAINAADRNIIYQVFRFVARYNGWDRRMRLLTLDKVLTTTDTGGGTKIVS